MVKKDTVKLFYEDPAGNYLPVKEEEWPAFNTAQELERQGYEEMRRLVESPVQGVAGGRN